MAIRVDHRRPFTIAGMMAFIAALALLLGLGREANRELEVFLDGGEPSLTGMAAVFTLCYAFLIGVFTLCYAFLIGVPYVLVILIPQLVIRGLLRRPPGHEMEDEEIL